MEKKIHPLQLAMFCLRKLNIHVNHLEFQSHQLKIEHNSWRLFR